MPRNPQQSTGAGFALRLRAFYGALFITLGVQMPFLPVWLAAMGLDAPTIGLVLALPMVVRVFAIPMATRLADRHDALRIVIVAVTVGAVAGYGVLGLAQGAAAIMIVYTVAAAFYSPAMLLTDTYALRGLAQFGGAYGPMRMWGSAAFIVSNLGAGLFLDLIAPQDLIWLIVACLALTAISASALAPLERSDSVAAEMPSARVLLRDRSFLLVVLATSLIQASHAVYYGFSTIDWRAAGFSGTTIGALWATGVIAEIVLFAASARLPRPIEPITLLLVGSAGAIARWGAMALDPPGALLPFIQFLHALSFGATHLGSLAFVARAAPAGLGATAQGYLSVALGLVIAGATSAAGVLYARYGDAAYAAMALTAGAGGVCALVARPRRT